MRSNNWSICRNRKVTSSVSVTDVAFNLYLSGCTQACLPTSLLFVEDCVFLQNQAVVAVGFFSKQCQKFNSTIASFLCAVVHMCVSPPNSGFSQNCSLSMQSIKDIVLGFCCVIENEKKNVTNCMTCTTKAEYTKTEALCFKQISSRWLAQSWDSRSQSYSRHQTKIKSCWRVIILGHLHIMSLWDFIWRN